MADKKALHRLLNIAADFVTRQEGQWNHGEWEDFLQKVSALGLEINDDTKRYLGNILEASKNLYPMAACLPSAEKAPAKRKPKPKAKPKP